MRVRITYRPLDITVPRWARAAVSEHLSRRRHTREQREQFEELIDDLHAHEGWAPAVKRVTPRRRKAVR